MQYDKRKRGQSDWTKNIVRYFYYAFINRRHTITVNLYLNCLTVKASQKVVKVKRITLNNVMVDFFSWHIRQMLNVMLFRHRNFIVLISICENYFQCISLFLSYQYCVFFHRILYSTIILSSRFTLTLY